MVGNSSRRKRRGRRVYTDELKAEAVQMLLDGHRAESVAENLGHDRSGSGDKLLGHVPRHAAVL